MVNFEFICLFALAKNVQIQSAAYFHFAIKRYFIEDYVFSFLVILFSDCLDLFSSLRLYFLLVMHLFGFYKPHFDQFTSLNIKYSYEALLFCFCDLRFLNPFLFSLSKHFFCFKDDDAPLLSNLVVLYFFQALKVLFSSLHQFQIN